MAREGAPTSILHLVGDREDAGGVLSVIRNLQEASCPREWRHAVWVHRDYRETRTPALDYRRADSVLAESSRHLDLLRRTFPAARELAALLRAEPFDVLHAHSRGTLLVSLLHSMRTRRPVLFTNHNYARRRGFYRWAARRLRTVLLTPAMARHYRLEGRTGIISACFADGFLEGETARPRDPGRRTLRLCGSGSIIGWKKWDLLVEAVARLPTALQQRLECRIRGPVLDRAFARKVESAIARGGLADRVRLCGPSPAIRAALLESDLLVLPSTDEPCSVALMEALALGLPVIASRSGGNTDIVGEGCGILFEPDDPGSLRECLEGVLEGRVRFRSPESIRDSVRHRAASRVLEDYGRLWRQMR